MSPLKVLFHYSKHQVMKPQIAIVVVPEADGTWTYSATITLHRAMVRSKRCSGAR